MTEKEVFACIKPLLDGVTEGLYWDFKKTLKENLFIKVACIFFKVYTDTSKDVLINQEITY